MILKWQSLYVTHSVGWGEKTIVYWSSGSEDYLSSLMDALTAKAIQQIPLGHEPFSKGDYASKASNSSLSYWDSGFEIKLVKNTHVSICTELNFMRNLRHCLDNTKHWNLIILWFCCMFLTSPFFFSPSHTPYTNTLRNPMYIWRVAL